MKFATKHAFGSALTLSLVALATHASAMAVALPPVNWPGSALLVVNWTLAPGASNINGATKIKLMTGSQVYWLADGYFNSGQRAVQFPANLACDPQADYRIRVTRYHSDGSNIDDGITTPFKFSCPIVVVKQVVNTTGRATLNSPFRVRIQCEPGSQAFVDMQAPSTLRRVVHVPVGSTWCTVQEMPTSSSAAGCAWRTTYPGGQQRTPGGPPVTIVNTLQCGPVTAPDPR